MTGNAMDQDIQTLSRIVEGALFAAGEALSLERLQGLFEEDERPAQKSLLQALSHLQESCSGRGFQLVEVASGWRFQVRADLAPWVNKLWEEKPQRYSRAVLETLALIAYRQPITRGDIEDVRGVSVSTQIIKTLAEREWIKVVGNRDVPGRPALYATTRQFLDYFGLKSLDELPSLSELKDIDGFADRLSAAEFGTDADEIEEDSSNGQDASALSSESPEPGDAGAHKPVQPITTGNGNNE